MADIKIFPCDNATQEQAVQQLESANFKIPRNGIGLPKGSYEILTADSGSFKAVKAITTNSNKKLGLTIIAGTIFDSKGATVEIAGLKETDKQLVMPLNVWLRLEPNTRYSFDLNESGYVGNVKGAEKAADTLPTEAPAATFEMKL